MLAYTTKEAREVEEDNPFETDFPLERGRHDPSHDNRLGEERHSRTFMHSRVLRSFAFAGGVL